MSRIGGEGKREVRCVMRYSMVRIAGSRVGAT